jgi:glyoxylase-like metal-dependent hydrolase (beta-lactamase superfamily II)
MLRGTATRRRLPSLLRDPPPYRFAGAPLRLGGDNRRLSADRLVGGGGMTVHALSGYMSVLYVVEYAAAADRKLLLLDGGVATDHERAMWFAEHALGRRGAAADRFGLVVCTHAHPDHCGSAVNWAAGGVPIAAPQGIDEYSRGARGAVQTAIENVLASYVAHRIGRSLEGRLSTGKVPNPRNDRRLADGDALPGFADWAAVRVPGHTSHMVALYHAATHTLYAADLLIQLKRGFVPPIPVDIPFAYLDTLRRLRELRVRWLLLPHGGVFDTEEFGGWQAVLSQAAAHVASPAKGGGGALMRAINRVVVFNTDANGFTKSMLPTGPMPACPEVAVPAVIDRGATRT